MLSTAGRLSTAAAVDDDDNGALWCGSTSSDAAARAASADMYCSWSGVDVELLTAAAMMGTRVVGLCDTCKGPLQAIADGCANTSTSLRTVENDNDAAVEQGTCYDAHMRWRILVLVPW